MGSWFEVKHGYLVWIDRAARVFQIETQLRVRWKEPRIGSNRAPRSADEVAARPPSTPGTLIWFLRNVNNFEVFSRTEKTGIFQIVMWWGWVVLKKPFDIIHERLQVDLLWFSDIVRNDWNWLKLRHENQRHHLQTHGLPIHFNFVTKITDTTCKRMAYQFILNFVSLSDEAYLTKLIAQKECNKLRQISLSHLQSTFPMHLCSSCGEVGVRETWTLVEARPPSTSGMLCCSSLKRIFRYTGFCQSVSSSEHFSNAFEIESFRICIH